MIDQFKFWEALGVALGLAYLLLAARRSLLCWAFAFASTAIFLAMVAMRGLYMQTLLHVFYLGMAVYGFMDWRKGRGEDGGVLIRSWGMRQHALAAAFIVIATVVNGWLLQKQTAAVAPYLDSFVTWGSVVTTFMVARRLIENWLYWIVVDGVAAYLFHTQDLQGMMLLYVIYIGIVIRGYFTWRHEQRMQKAPAEDRPAGAEQDVAW